VAGPDEGDLGRQAIIAIRSYKFVLAFENSISTDYATEKLYRPLAHGTVPVYLGAPNVSDLVPDDDSVVVVSEFGSPRELADRLLELDADDDAYQRHHRWRGSPRNAGFRRLVEVGSVDPMVRLARKLIHGCGRSCACGGRMRDPGVLS
jgi:hypothetical protein